jgi:hypothetical protein
VFYQQYGKGNVPIVLIHGMGACYDHWKKLITELGPQYTAYAFDLLGFGDSDKPAHPPHKHLYDYQTWSQQTLDFISEVGGFSRVIKGRPCLSLFACHTSHYVYITFSTNTTINSSSSSLHLKFHQLHKQYLHDKQFNNSSSCLQLPKPPPRRGGEAAQCV